MASNRVAGLQNRFRPLPGCEAIEQGKQLGQRDLGIRQKRSHQTISSPPLARKQTEQTAAMACEHLTRLCQVCVPGSFGKLASDLRPALFQGCGRIGKVGSLLDAMVPDGGCECFRAGIGSPFERVCDLDKPGDQTECFSRSRHSQLLL